MIMIFQSFHLKSLYAQDFTTTPYKIRNENWFIWFSFN